MSVLKKVRWNVLIVSGIFGGWDRLVVIWSQIFTAIGVMSIFCFSPWLDYSSYQYVAAAILIFVSTNVLEGICFLCACKKLCIST
jgi:hypothetical protein